MVRSDTFVQTRRMTRANATPSDRIALALDPRRARETRIDARSAKGIRALDTRRPGGLRIHPLVASRDANALVAKRSESDVAEAPHASTLEALLVLMGGVG